MIICGLKLTHDGAIALLDDNELIFSIEMEKIDNNLRYTEILDTSIIENVLNDAGYSISDIDFFAIDGWGGTDQDSLALLPRLEISKDFNYLTAENHGEKYKLGVATYKENNIKDNILQELKFEGLKIGDNTVPYSSFLHVTGHLLSAYLTSEFYKNGESSYVLVWDGGMYPGLYYFDYNTKQIQNLGPIFLLIGNIYTIFSQHFGPFKVNGSFASDSLSIAGKVMAYIALGQVRKELFSIFDEIIESFYDKPMGLANTLAREFINHSSRQLYSDEDILCTFHFYIEKLLITKLKKKIERVDFNNRNLCIAGGCALNIKWNSAIRECGFFDGVYVPPFPNDSGSAIGVACAKLLSEVEVDNFKWTVYSGPEVKQSSIPEGWISRSFSIRELASLLHETGEPVVFLNQKAELGPRALGNRSIIESPKSHNAKSILNHVKDRESYRPISPICLEDKAMLYFDPGTKDPFMLFDHMVRPAYKEIIPAVMHLDGSARLQTINLKDNSVIHELLTEFERISGLPILCNTSANYKGSGFFPDVFSATTWGRVNYVWNNNELFEKVDKIKFATNYESK